MTIQADSLVRKVRRFALDRDSNIDQAIDSVLDEKFENEGLFEANETEIRDGLQKSLLGFSFLQAYLDDDAIEEVWINKPGELWFAKSGKHFRHELLFTAEEIKTLVERMIRSSGRRLDRSTPFIDAQLESGYRLHAVIPDITQNHLSLNIRKFSSNVMTIDDLVSGEVLARQTADYLVSEISSGSNVMISGATQAGKTTLLAALLSALSPDERVISVEDTFELRCLLPDWVALQTRPESVEGKFGIDLRRLVRETLRMRPTRLVVGEVRGAEALDMLIAMNSGIPGMCTVHANSSHEALQKLLTLPLLAGGNISTQFLESVVRTSLKLFVHCARDTNGRRFVKSIMRVQSGQTLQLEEVIL